MDIAAVSLLIVTIINAYWTWQAKKVQNDRDIIKAQQEQLVMKDEEISQLKAQYNHLLITHKKIEGENKTYKRFHNHVDEQQKLV